MNVMIAEDNIVNRELLREMLEARGHQISEACNGAEAIEMLNQGLPDILLLDLNMPVLDGYGTIEKIRGSANLASLPVLAVTAYAMQGDRERILAAGFDGYVSKPINWSALSLELERVMARKDSSSGDGSAKGAGA